MKTVFTALFLFVVAAGTIVVAPRATEAASAAEIDADANETLHSFVRLGIRPSTWSSATALRLNWS